MNSSSITTVLERTRPPFRETCEKKGLLHTGVSVLAESLASEEAIGNPDRRDFPIVVGKERVVASTVLGTRGHAFTDSPRCFSGVIDDVLGLELTDNANRSIYVATLNAVLGHLKMVRATVHCRDNDPETCALEIADRLFKTHGSARIGLIGFNPAIAERLVNNFGPDRVRITDLNKDNVGQQRFDVEVWNGRARTDELIDTSDFVLITGTTLVNGTFDAIWNRIRSVGKDYLVYGVTAAGVCAMMGIPRICPLGREV